MRERARSTPPPTPETSPSASADPNEAACSDFATTSIEVAEGVVAGEGLDIDIPAMYDEVALRAEGDVKSRILTLVENLPEPPHMIAWMDNRDAYSADVEAVVRACEAAGHLISAATLVAANQ